MLSARNPSLREMVSAVAATRGPWIRRQGGFVFQNFENQIVLPLVAEDLAFGAKDLGLRGFNFTARVDGVLERRGFSRLLSLVIREESCDEQQVQHRG